MTLVCSDGLQEATPQGVHPGDRLRIPALRLRAAAGSSPSATPRCSAQATGKPQPGKPILPGKKAKEIHFKPGKEHQRAFLSWGGNRAPVGMHSHSFLNSEKLPSPGAKGNMGFLCCSLMDVFPSGSAHFSQPFSNIKSLDILNILLT